MYLFTIITLIKKTHCVKSVRVRILSGPHFLAFVRNTESYSLNLVFSPNAGK